MYLVLIQDVDKIGKKNDIVKVKNGYGRNYLLPLGLAEFCTEPKLKQIKVEIEAKQKRAADMKDMAKQVAQKLKDLKLTIKKKITAKGTLYGGVTEKTIADEINKEVKVKLDPELIIIKEPIKKAGEYRIQVNLTADTKTFFKLIVKEEK